MADVSASVGVSLPSSSPPLLPPPLTLPPQLPDDNNNATSAPRQRHQRCPTPAMPAHHDTAAPPLIEGCGQRIGGYGWRWDDPGGPVRRETHKVRLLPILPLSRGHTSMAVAYFTHTHRLTQCQHHPTDTQAWRQRRIHPHPLPHSMPAPSHRYTSTVVAYSPTPAASLNASTIPQIHEHGGGVFTHTRRLTQSQHHPADTRARQWRISPTPTASLNPNTIPRIHEHGSGVFHPHPPPHSIPTPSADTQAQRRHISPTPATSLNANTILPPHGHGSGVFHPHPPPHSIPTPSHGYMSTAAAYFTHTRHLTQCQHHPATTRTRRRCILPTPAVLFVSNTFLWPHECGGSLNASTIPWIHEHSGGVFTHTRHLTQCQHHPATTRTRRRCILPTPAVLFVSNIFPWPHECGGGVFNPHPPSHLLATLSKFL
jgi:hypothetical protein